MPAHRSALHVGVAALVAVAATASLGHAAPPDARDTTTLAVVAHPDSAARLAPARHDSTAGPARVRTAPPPSTAGRGFYVGVGGGASLPLGDVKEGWKTGWTVFVPVGYDRAGSPLGIRVDGGYDRWKGKVESDETYGDYKLWSVNGDVKLRFPYDQPMPKVQVYGLAGGGVHHLSVGAAETGGIYGSSDGGGSTTKPSWDAGAGLAFGIGGASLLLESRYFSVRSNGSTVKWYPVVAAVTYAFR